MKPIALFLLALLLPSTRLLGDDPPPVASDAFKKQLQALAPLADRFYRQEKWDLAFPSGEVRSVVYGNDRFGFFESRHFEKTGKQQLEFSFVPPTYQEALEFWIRRNGDQPLFLVKRATFTNPFAAVHAVPETQLQGEISANFILMNFGWKEQASGFIAYLPTIMNKWGEVVWAYLPSGGKKLFPTYWAFKPVGQRLAALTPSDASYFEVFDLRGKVFQTADPATSTEPYYLHHDFVASLKGDRVVTLGYLLKNFDDCQTLYDTAAKANKGPRPVGPDPCQKRPLSAIGNSIQEVDLKKNLAKQLWNPFLSFPCPVGGRWPDYCARMLPAPTLAVLDQQLKASPAGSATSDHGFHADWMHANSIERIPGKGYLISFREFSRVVLVDKDLHSVDWTVGGSAESTYRFEDPQLAFSAQHHATINRRGNLLLFDNRGAASSRLLEIQLTGHQAKTVWEFVPSPPLVAKTRGSVFELRNSHLLGYFPGDAGDRDVIVEVDTATGKETGRLTVFHRDKDWFGYRGTPVETLSDESFRSTKQ